MGKGRRTTSGAKGLFLRAPPIARGEEWSVRARVL
jgi:hypothetical protein